MAPEDAGQFDNPGASPAMSSSSSSIITQLPLPLTSLSKLTASLPQSVTDLVANLPFMSKQEVTHGWVECERREISRCPRITDTEDVDIRIIGGTKKEESDSDEDGDTDIRNTLAKSKLDEPTEPKKLTEQPPSVDVLALMNSLKKSGLLNKVQGACVLPAATCSSMSAAMSAAMAAAITTMPSPTVSSPTSMPMQPSPTSRFDNPPPQSMIHRFGVPPPSMPGFLPPFSAPPPQFSSSPGLLAAAANRQFAGNVAAAALAVAPFSSPPPCLLPPPGLIQPPGLIVPPAPVVISNRLSLDQVDASDGTTPPGLADHSSSSVEHNPVATTAPPASLDSNATTAQMPARTFVKQCTYYASGGCHFGDNGCCERRWRRGRGGFRGGPRGGGPPRGPPGNYARPPTGPNPTMNAVGGGVEIDYDEREGRIRTYQVPASHIMISDPRGRGGRGRGRFTSPLRRGYYDERGSGGRYSSNRRRRSRSSSNSLSPVRSSGASKGDVPNPIPVQSKKAAEDGGRKSSRNDEDSVLGESSSPGSALLLEITDCLANEPLEPRKNHNNSTAEAMEEDEREAKQAYSPPRNYKSKSSSSRRRGKSEHTGSPTSSSSSPESPDPIPAPSDSSTTNTPPRKSRANAAASEDEEE
uniref:C3H1-type domain-containing protein n=1 Tax=Ditylenchus dipsaci TaxID=166011 RepID=A0A915DYE6_9BILA